MGYQYPNHYNQTYSYNPNQYINYQSQQYPYQNQFSQYHGYFNQYVPPDTQCYTTPQFGTYFTPNTPQHNSNQYNTNQFYQNM